MTSMAIYVDFGSFHVTFLLAEVTIIRSMFITLALIIGMCPAMVSGKDSDGWFSFRFVLVSVGIDSRLAVMNPSTVGLGPVERFTQRCLFPTTCRRNHRVKAGDVR